MKKEILAEFLGTSRTTAFNYWSEQPKRPHIQFIEKYLSDGDLQEFLTLGKMSKLDNAAESDIVDQLFLSLPQDRIKILAGFFSHLRSAQQISKMLDDQFLKIKFFRYIISVFDDDKILRDEIEWFEKNIAAMTKIAAGQKDNFGRLYLQSGKNNDNFCQFLSDYLQVGLSELDNFIRERDTRRSALVRKHQENL